VANDVIRSRASILTETITKWGSDNTIVTQSDPSAFGRLTGFFDIIMVDAPCSGEGMFRTDIALSEWSPENTALCAERQKRILMEIWPALKENGILIYSTCTFNPDENEENIKWLLSRNEAESIKLDLKSFGGITEIDRRGIFGYGFYPDKVRGEGFFISAVRKKSRQEYKFPKSSRLPELKPGKSDLEVVSAWTDFKTDRIIKWGEEIIALPCNIEEYTHVFRNLKVVKGGTVISVKKQNDNIPSHALALSKRLKKNAFPRLELSLTDAISYLRRDSFNVSEIPKGWNIMTFSGIDLGFIKNLGNRVNNYFPVEWRIRLDASAIRDAIRISWHEKPYN
jgi:NOL1/NOP2/fmu family ribosome biogenesis protein